MMGRWIIAAVAGLLMGGAAALLVLPEARTKLLGGGDGGAVIGKAQVGGPFALVDQTGKPVTDADYRGRFMLIYFGFTHCPDICPSSLQVMTAALDQIGPLADRITPVLISLDPERDTPAQMALYVKSFHPRLVGLTGTQEQIAAVAKSYRVYFRKVKDESSSAAYTLDHTSILYLMSPKGEFITHFSHTTSVDSVAERLRKAVQQAGS